jgi:hygromycin-B 7''-O-kinase
MPALLPANVSYDHYWETIYHQPLLYWEPAIDAICARHSLSARGRERAALGRNIVFLSGALIIKLSPPFWVHEISREAAALTFVQDRLPVAVPAPLATGELVSWNYLVETRLPGTLLRSIWATLQPPEKKALAYQHGTICAALHALPAQEAPAILGFNWAGMLTEQAEECIPEMRRSGVSDGLIADVDAYLEEAFALLANDTELRLLHGDLDAINLLAEHQGGQWRITGLVDWGDIKLGPIAHEFISPRIHMYRAEAGMLERWYEGYGFTPGALTPELKQNLMARTMLYYAGEFGAILDQVPGARECQSWAEVAECFWEA